MNLKQELLKLKLARKYTTGHLNRKGDYVSQDNVEYLSMSDELADQIDTLYRNKMLELIGEDDSYNEVCDHCSNYDDGRNELRAEIRQKLAIDNIKGAE